MSQHKITKKIIKLKYPITITRDEQPIEIKKIVLTRPKVKQLRKFPDSFFEKEGHNLSANDIFPVLESLTNLEPDILDEIDVEDMNTICEGFESFFQKSPRTGKS